MTTIRSIPAGAALLASLCLAAAPAARAQRAKPTTACAILSAAEIQRATGRTDLATAPQEAHDEARVSYCQRSGAIDLILTLRPESKAGFARMRETFAKAPARAGIRVEPAAGVGDDAYWVLQRRRVQLKTLVGDRELTTELTKLSSSGGEMPTDPAAKAIAMKLAKAGAAKLR